MVYSDYAKTNLADNTFDFTVINGDIAYENPYEVIKEAERITKENGIIFCCSHENYLLASTFQLIFSNRKEYSITPMDVIITAKKTNDKWDRKEDIDYRSEFNTAMYQLKKEIEGANRIEVYRECVKKLNKYIDISIKQYDMEKKLNLIQLKENLLDYMNHLNTVHKEFYQKKLLSMLRNIVHDVSVP